jgi:D-alanyl-D-alanine carboxypeptidase (penicillin-binding protein 5/6)
VRDRRSRAAIVAAGLLAQVVAIAAAGVGAQPRTSVPPPTPVNGQPSPFQTELRTPADGSRRPTPSAATALLVDLDSGDVLFSKAANTRRPIASITKIMTAVVVLERTRPRDVVTVTADAVFGRNDYGVSSTVGLRAGERQTVRDLLYVALLGSANDAARALAIHVAGSEAGFVRLMNDRARSLHMRDTRFSSATGLDDRGRSTAEDLLLLVRAALRTRGLPQIVQALVHEIPAPRGSRRIQNRNVLLWLYRGATGMKTGYTAAAGFCLVATAERDGRRLVTIVLGAPGDAFSDAAALMNYGLEGFARRTIVRAGEALGGVRVRGGSVEVVAGEDLETLVPTQDLAAVRFRLRVDPRVAFPPAIGDVVGTYRATAAGRPLGSVPIIVARVPAPIDPGPTPWWVRAAVAVAGAVGSVIGALF